MSETVIHASLFQKDSDKCKPLEDIREKSNDFCHGFDPVTHDHILIDLHGKASTQVVTEASVKASNTSILINVRPVKTSAHNCSM